MGFWRRLERKKGEGIGRNKIQIFKYLKKNSLQNYINMILLRQHNLFT